MLENTIGIITLAVVLYTMTRFKLSFVHLTLLELVRIGIAIYALMEVFSLESLYNYYCKVVAVFSVGMLIGYYRFKRADKPFQTDSTDITLLALEKRSLVRVLIVFGLFIVYHYSIAGIPILSQDYEIKRFLVASSGLLGIPSRIGVYGPIIIVVFSLSYYSKKILSSREILGILSIGLLCFWLTGHKSAIIAFIFTNICFYRYIDKAINKKFLVLMISGLFAIAMISISIQLPYFYSLKHLGLWEYIKMRLSFISIQPLIYIYYDTPDITTITPFAFIHDLFYPFLKLFGHEIYSVNTQISYGLYGTEYGEFTVPVTYTYAGYAILEFGKNGGIVFSLIIGYLSAAFYFQTHIQNNPRRIATFMTLEYFLFIGLTTGNLFYLIPNVLIVLIMFLVLLKIFHYKFIVSRSNQIS
jgi:oligosaccharide repeat unit polymerase